MLSENTLALRLQAAIAARDAAAALVDVNALADADNLAGLPVHEALALYRDVVGPYDEAVKVAKDALRQARARARA